MCLNRVFFPCLPFMLLLTLDWPGVRPSTCPSSLEAALLCIATASTTHTLLFQALWLSRCSHVPPSPEIIFWALPTYHVDERPLNTLKSGEGEQQRTEI